MGSSVSLVGVGLPEFVAPERDQVRFFCSVVGLDDLVHHDTDAAQGAGCRDLLLPPTYLFILELRRPDPYGYMAALGFETRQLLHGSQRFEYAASAHAGDSLT